MPPKRLRGALEDELLLLQEVGTTLPSQGAAVLQKVCAHGSEPKTLQTETSRDVWAHRAHVTVEGVRQPCTSEILMEMFLNCEIQCYHNLKRAKAKQPPIIMQTTCLGTGQVIS